MPESHVSYKIINHAEDQEYEQAGAHKESLCTGFRILCFAPVYSVVKLITEETQNSSKVLSFKL